MMLYTVNRIDSGKPMEHYAPGEPHDRQPKTWDTREAAQHEADMNNIMRHTWMVVPHAEGSSMESKEAING